MGMFPSLAQAGLQIARQNELLPNNEMLLLETREQNSVELNAKFLGSDRIDKGIFIVSQIQIEIYIYKELLIEKHFNPVRQRIVDKQGRTDNQTQRIQKQNVDKILN